MVMPAKPLELHELHGTKSVAKNPGASQVPGGRPKFSKGLSPQARTIFKQLCKQLELRKTLTEGDQSLLTLFATTWDTWRKAQNHVEAEGAVVSITMYAKGGEPYQTEKVSPHFTVASAAHKQLIGILDRLGLTPKARDQVKPTHGGNEPKPENIPGTAAWAAAHGGNFNAE